MQTSVKTNFQFPPKLIPANALVFLGSPLTFSWYNTVIKKFEWCQTLPYMHVSIFTNLAKKLFMALLTQWQTICWSKNQFSHSVDTRSNVHSKFKPLWQFLVFRLTKSWAGIYSDLQPRRSSSTCSGILVLNYWLRIQLRRWQNQRKRCLNLFSPSHNQTFFWHTFKGY